MKVLLAELSNVEYYDKRNILDINNNKLIYEKVPFLHKENADILNEFPSWMIILFSAISNKHSVSLFIGDRTNIVKKYSEEKYDYIIMTELIANSSKLKLLKTVFNIPLILLSYLEEDKKNLKFTNINDILVFLKTSFTSYKKISNELFKTSVPRITLVNGCPGNCSFCTVNKKVQKVDMNSIEAEFKLFKHHKTIYIGNPTFGLYNNWELNILSKYNKDYIVQTRSDVVLKNDVIRWKEAGVKYVELGVESFNNSSLKVINKGETVEQHIQAITKLNIVGIKVILNVIIGIPKDAKLSNTVHTIRKLRHRLYYLNIFYYSDYNANNYFDRDELNMIKSFNSETIDIKSVLSLYKLNYELLNEIK